MKNISHMQLFLDSLTNPKKLGAYRILSIGKVMQYAFLMIALLTAFSFGQFVNGGTDAIFGYSEIEQYAADIQWIVYPIAVVFLFVLNSSVYFIKVSLYALAGQFFVKPMKRRGEYRQVWRSAVFACTWATLLTMIGNLFPISANIITLISIFITMLFIIIAITKYPLTK
ncbi:DUF1189 domain-containing protein [Solibacillus sp. MA9]|uniref:DUF1189 domain-containing protein n=1 Tax=Solibacillus palustris TaxID=2908203 RepID=A0ABS9UCI3_9BACL|nr:DUF1189 family protein [Solibacillus sp. MA9]MCH7321683.1 DUF1189 domain-containing protein [Solibacillus sp. MA9]